MDDSQEEWKPVIGFDGRYEVSKQGQVRSLLTGRVLKPGVNSRGYEMVWLSSAGHDRCCCVHRLVAAAFIGPLPAGLVINHLDGCKTNNVASNLEYATQGENQRHAYRIGLRGVVTPRDKLGRFSVA